MKLRSSFRDPSGYVFTENGVVFRQVNDSYKKNYDLLMESGLYKRLVDLKLLIPHEEERPAPSATAGVYKIVRPDPIPFISYPYEWSFSQLKDAALTTLRVQRIALKFGMTLKDASAYNIQFMKGRPIFIDTLSFNKYAEGEPWQAYQQFCQHFLGPLALMSYKHVGAAQLSRNHIDGIPLDLTSTLLPIRTHLKPGIQIHIHLHAKLQTAFADKAPSKIKRTKSFKLRSFLGLLDSLESTVKRLRCRQPRTEWTEYYEDDAYPQESLDSKIQIVTGFIKKVQPHTVWDLGANSGLFSRLASNMAIRTVSFDKDSSVVEENYLKTVHQKEENILPLVLDLTNPSPRIGWANRERMDLSERGPSDMLMALALLHHLAIANNLPFEMVAEFFSELCNWAIIEFVPKSDAQVDRMLATREDTFSTYNEQNFEQEFEKRFNIISKECIKGSNRTLYLMQCK